MTFSREVKNEIIQSFKESNNELSILSGALLSAGTLVIANKKLSFTISSEIEEFLSFIKSVITKLTGETNFDEVLKKSKYNNKNTYTLSPPAKTGEEILMLCGIVYRDEFGRMQINYAGDTHLLSEDKSRIDYLGSAFVGSGSVSIPEADGNQKKNSGYHIEWSCQMEEQANRISEILASFDIITKQVERNGELVVYVKESETISDILKLLKAHKSVLKFENGRVSRDIRNLANRQANCTVANIEKTVLASQKQMDAIQVINEIIGIDSLPESLKEIAVARLNNPEATLTELGANLPKPISRGAVNQRFNKIIEIAKEVGNG